jgi:two-component system, chemotaxis family, sensor kinase CheA
VNGMPQAAEISAEEIKVFLEEADEQIALLDRNIVRLENEGQNVDLLQEIFRAAHTIKGSSAMLGHQPMAEVAHAMESLLDNLRNRTMTVSTEAIDGLLQGLDLLKTLKDGILTAAPMDIHIEAVVGRLRELTEEDAVHVDRDSAPSVGATDVLRRADTEGPMLQPETPDKARGIIKGIAPEKRQTFQSIRVDVKTLDSLMNMVEELVVDRSRMTQVGRMLESKYPDDVLIRDLEQTTNHIVKVINELQQDVMQVRMLPIGTLFSGFPRMVRDLAQSQGKKLDFVVEGEDTELDRTIIEQIRDPLIHLLRNAVDHGVESPEERLLAGKPEAATVRLTAYQTEGHIVIEVSDDGRGIDFKAVKESSVKKGFITAEEASRLSDDEASNLIFLSGLSTSDEVTEISGRGVGMDLVKTNINSLRGSVTTESQLGKGTKFTLTLPLTVAVIQGLLVSSGETVYVIPLEAALEILRIEAAEIKTIRGREVIRLRDEIIPLIGIDASSSPHPSTPEQDGRCFIVVVKDGTRSVGITVDDLMEEQEFVVKPLGTYVGEVKGIAGATILGDGQVALILDVPTLIRSALQR